MFSREQKRAAMYKKLQLLRSITNSHAHNYTSMILEASKYIKDLKQKVQTLNQDMGTAQSSSAQNHLPVIIVEEQEKEFLIKVVSEGNCQGLLVFLLEAFEALGLDVLQARVSASNSFLLEAFAAKENKEADHINAQVVREGLLQAIHNWSEVSKQEH